MKRGASTIRVQGGCPQCVHLKSFNAVLLFILSRLVDLYNARLACVYTVDNLWYAYAFTIRNSFVICAFLLRSAYSIGTYIHRVFKFYSFKTVVWTDKSLSWSVYWKRTPAICIPCFFFFFAVATAVYETR